MRLVLSLVVVGCVAPEAPTPAPQDGEVALVRIADGDSLSGIADRLSFPGGWRALARANGITGDFIRASAGLRVPVAYLRTAGIDPYTEMGLEPYPAHVPARPLVACRAEQSTGDCVSVGDATACIDDLPPRDRTAEREVEEDHPDGTIDNPGRDGRQLVITRGTAAPIDIMLPNGGYPDDERLTLTRVDLDGDRRDELVIAAPIEIRNHLGWRFTRVVVVGDAGVVQLDAAQWGVGSLVDNGAGGCDVLATSWESLRHPVDGDGMYLVGRPMEYAHGELVPRGDLVARRMRRRLYWDDGELEHPAEWLSDPSATWWPELGPEQRVRDHHDGTVANVHVVDGSVVLDIDLMNQTRVRFDPGLVGDDDVPARDTARLDRLGWAPTSALLPEAFVPADPSRWIGAKVIVTDENDEDDWATPDAHNMHTVWISPSR